MRSLKFELLDNGIDSLKQGIEFVLEYQADPSKLKIAILLLSQAVELILKERLQREHWSLIFKDIEKAGAENANTVSLEEARKRLERIAGVIIERDRWEPVEYLQKVRNNIQHFKVDLKFEAAISLVNDVIPFLTYFLRKHLEIDIKELLNGDNYQKLLEIDGINKELKINARARIDRCIRRITGGRISKLADIVFEKLNCPICWENLYVFCPSELISKCELCGYEGGIATCSHCGHLFPPDIGFHEFDIDTNGLLCNDCRSSLALQFPYEE